MTEVMQGTLRPLAEALFHTDSSGRPAALIGAACADCGRVVFPARSSCPSCGPASELRPYRLSTEGTVYSATTVHVPSPLGHRPPYAYGYVDLPEDRTRIFAPLFAPSERVWRAGESVSLVFREIDALGLPETLGYGFVLREGSR